MSEYNKVAYEADRFVEAISGGKQSIEEFVSGKSTSVEQLREVMTPKSREDYMSLFDLALRLNVSPFWLMGYDAPKEQTEYEAKLRKMLLAVDKMAKSPRMLEAMLHLIGLSEEDLHGIA